MSEDEIDRREEEVLVRRIDRRLEPKRDYPWLRRIIGFTIIASAFFFGWKSLNRQTDAILKYRAQNQALHPQGTATPAPLKQDDTKKQNVSGMTAPIATEYGVDMPAPLDGPTLNTISECTKGANAFRNLNFDREKIASGDATLETVFTPVFVATKGQSKRTVQLQNVRIRTKTGEELRLHGSPQTQNGLLYLKLFKVLDDGLPAEADFPEAIKDLKDQPLSDYAISRFLLLSETPGRALEVERHEAWSYPEKAGAQVIWSGDRIFELQVFMRGKFLACSRGMKSNLPNISCKCVDRWS